MRGQARSWLLPDEPAPVRLMNTIWADTAGVHDALALPADLDAWLDAAGLDATGLGTASLGTASLGRLAACATPGDLTAARALRDAARRLAAYLTGDPRTAAVSATGSVPDALAAVNQAARELPAAQLELRDGRLRSVPWVRASPVAAGMARVADAAIELLSGTAAGTLRACLAPGCVLYFTKTHPRREWCSVACGNRARAARHYEKARAARQR